ncbi:MAG TPA: ANTAR domain-containing protein [Streptosporangiaceae bacterium]|jgi:hypothetical protein
MARVADDRALVLSERIAVAKAALEGTVQRLQDSSARLATTRHEVGAARSRRELLHDVAYARLEARLAAMPVIEQAKGVLMAQTGCGPEEASGLLRRESGHANVSVRELAAEVVRGPHTGRGQASPLGDGF